MALSTTPPRRVVRTASGPGDAAAVRATPRQQHRRRRCRHCAPPAPSRAETLRHWRRAAARNAWGARGDAAQSRWPPTRSCDTA
eukprot:ctg_2681.g513